MIITSIIFIVAYILIVIEKYPPPIVAMLGGILLVDIHIFGEKDAVSFIDLNTIGLLCGMMIIVSVFKRTGLLDYLAIKAVKSTRGNPWHLMVVLALLTAFLSAILDNVTTVLIIAPITIAITDVIRIQPMPFLIAEIFFSNIGGTATLIGDPPNILIGSSADISFLSFILHNGPIVLLAMIVTLYFLKVIYYKPLQTPIDKRLLSQFNESNLIQDKRNCLIAVIIFSLVILAFLSHNVLHLELSTIALSGAFLMILVTKTDLDEILKEVEWSTLFFFIGLFILVGGLKHSGVIDFVSEIIINTTSDTMILSQIILWFSAIASTIVDNIPLTATLISIISSMQEMSDIDISSLWWALSLGACFGGNGTIVGAAANIIVVNIAKRNNVNIKFMDFIKIGYPLIILLLSLSSVYIFVVHFVLKLTF